MGSNTYYCHILEGQVTIISDIYGNVTRVVCPEINRATNTCMKKYGSSIPFITTIPKRLMDESVGTRTLYCEFI